MARARQSVRVEDAEAVAAGVNENGGARGERRRFVLDPAGVAECYGVLSIELPTL